MHIVEKYLLDKKLVVGVPHVVHILGESKVIILPLQKFSLDLQQIFAVLV
jgi:hypothetical protein